MTLAIVHNQCLPYRHFLFQALAQSFDIDFFFFNQTPDALPPGLNATLLRGWKLPRFSDYWVQPALGRALRRRPYEAIIGGDLGAYNTAVAYRVARARGVPFGMFIEEWDVIRHPRRRLRRGIERRMLTGAAAVMTLGAKHRRYLAGRGVPAERLFTVPNCVDVRVQPPDPCHPLHAQVQAWRAGRPLVVTVGRHVAFKGQGQLLRAQARLERDHPDVAPALVLAGDGPLFARNKALAEQLGLRHAHFVQRFVDEADKAVLYGLADVFALSSTRTTAYETWGMVCNEAAAYGLPQVVTDAVGAGEEVVRHGENGYIVPDRDEAALATRLLELCGDATLRQRFGEASHRIYAEGYTPELMVQRFSQAVEALLREARGPA